MENIKFIYLYRDGGNYKNWGEVIFANPLGLTPNVITPKLNRAFMTDGLFIAHQIRIPEVLFYCSGYLTIDDHCFHEFDSVEPTAGIHTDRLGRSINELMSEVKQEALAGWRAFDPYDRLQRIPRKNWSE